MTPFRTTTRTPRRRGFALLLVVGCLLIVTVAAVSACRRSLSLALEAATLEEQVRRRWELATLERAGLTMAVAAYGGPPVELGAPASAAKLVIPRRAPRHEFEIRLNERAYHVALADESAKANLNMAAGLKPRALTELTRALSSGRLQLSAPSEMKAKSAGSALPNLFDWRDLLSGRAARGEDPPLSDLAVSAAHLTTWGDGRVNLLSASDPVLYELSRLILSDGESRNWVAEYRGSFPRRTPQDIFRELGFNPQQQRALCELASTQSTGVSVWVIGEYQSSLCIATRRGSGAWHSAVMQRSETPLSSQSP